MCQCGLANSVVENKLILDFSENKLVVLPPHVANNPQRTQPNNQDTGVVDSGTRNIYSHKEAPLQNSNAAAPKVHVGTATCQVQTSIVMLTLNLPHLPADLPRTGHAMPSFKKHL